MSNLTNMRNHLHYMRGVVEKLSHADRAAHEAYLTSAAHQEYDAARMELANLEEQCRQAILDDFDQHGDKEPVLGFKVQERKSVSYDEGDALAWALEHKLALKLDATKFKKYADDLPFVTVQLRPTAAIATDLTQYINNKGDDDE